MIAARKLKVREAVDLFLEDRARYYDSGEGPSRHLANVRSGLQRWLVRFCGDRWLYELDSILLDHMLEQWVGSGRLGRTSVNRNLSFVRQFMKFCVRRGYASPDQLVQIQSVDRIRRGRYGVTDADPIRPVSDEHYQAVLPYLDDRSRDTIEMIYLTGMRPGEVRLMQVARLGRVTVDGQDVLLYKPRLHKTAYLGKRRSVPIVGRALEIVEQRLAGVDETGEGYVFGKDGTFGWEPVDEGKLGRTLREACRAAGVPRWTPMQLRHRWATVARARRLKMKRISGLMGHTKTRTTEIYAEPSDELAIRDMLRLSAAS